MKYLRLDEKLLEIIIPENYKIRNDNVFEKIHLNYLEFALINL